MYIVDTQAGMGKHWAWQQFQKRMPLPEDVKAKLRRSLITAIRVIEVIRVIGVIRAIRAIGLRVITLITVIMAIHTHEDTYTHKCTHTPSLTQRREGGN